ncbi:MAG: hypothetical protein ACFBSC_06740 [Microcoleaceae cyanobacterium]
MATGLAVSVGMFDLLPAPATRFQFQQEVDQQLLSGTFEGSDSNADGVLELSEVDNFQASWGDYRWTQDDLEAFVWNKQEGSESDTSQASAIKLFARNQTSPGRQILQIQNRHVETSEGKQVNQTVQGLEYGANTPDSTLFSAQNLSLELSSTPLRDDWSLLAFVFVLTVGSLSLFGALGDNVRTQDQLYSN